MSKIVAFVVVFALFLPNVNLTYGADFEQGLAESDVKLLEAEKKLNKVISITVNEDLNNVNLVLKNKNLKLEQRNQAINKRIKLGKIRSYRDLDDGLSVEDAQVYIIKQGYESDSDFEDLCIEIESYKDKNSDADIKDIVKFFDEKAGLVDENNISISFLDSMTANAYSVSYSAWTKLTTAEKLLVATNPSAALKTNAIQKKAFDFTQAKFNNNGLGDQSDGYRHGIWNALMTRDISRAWAESIATAHEDRPKAELDKKQADGFTGHQHKAMDLNNNKVGRSVIAWYEFSVNCSDDLVKSRISAKLTNKSGGITWLHK